MTERNSHAGRSAPAVRLFSDAELAELARPPREQVEAAAQRSPEDLRETLLGLAGRHLRFSQGYEPWLSAIYDFLSERHGADSAQRAAAAEAKLADAYPEAAGDAPDSAQLEAVAQAASARVAAGEAGEALALWDSLSDALLQHHDAERDRISLVLSHVYRTYGANELEACHRYCAERTLLRWMPRDLERDPADRLRTWAGMQLGNFSRLSIEEDGEKFTLRQDPCGTCSRQIQAGGHEAPLDLAIVREACPLSFGDGGVPVYRSHVAVFHYLLPMERGGVPWPVIRCPRQLGTGPCRVLLYKDPSRTPPEHATEMGMPPTRALPASPTRS